MSHNIFNLRFKPKTKTETPKNSVTSELSCSITCTQQFSIQSQSTSKATNFIKTYRCLIACNFSFENQRNKEFPSELWVNSNNSENFAIKLV